MFRGGTDLLCIYVALRLSYSGPGLEGSHQPSSGKQQTTGQQGGASVVSRLTEGLCETLFCLFRGSLYVGLFFLVCLVLFFNLKLFEMFSLQLILIIGFKVELALVLGAQLENSQSSSLRVSLEM